MLKAGCIRAVVPHEACHQRNGDRVSLPFPEGLFMYGECECEQLESGGLHSQWRSISSGSLEDTHPSSHLGVVGLILKVTVETFGRTGKARIGESM